MHEKVSCNTGKTIFFALNNNRSKTLARSKEERRTLKSNTAKREHEDEPLNFCNGDVRNARLTPVQSKSICEISTADTSHSFMYVVSWSRTSSVVIEILATLLMVKQVG